jgi:putative ABC transport system permease protein
MSANLSVTTLINVLFAAVIAVGVVYNAARVSLSEHSRELASLRVLGFTRYRDFDGAARRAHRPHDRGAADRMGGGLPVGRSDGPHGESEVYRIPLTVAPWAVAWASLGIVAAAVGSGLLVRRRLDRLDLVAVLKTQE